MVQTFEEWVRYHNEDNDFPFSQKQIDSARAAWTYLQAESAAEVDRLRAELFKPVTCEICGLPTRGSAKSTVDERCLGKLRAELATLREAITEKAAAWKLSHEDEENHSCIVENECADELLALLAQPPKAGGNKPKIICLCGSTRFIEQFAIKTWELEREGNIVLGCTLLPMWYCKVPSHFGEATGTKEQCDALHLRKIDLADEILVLNIGGYIGESTRNEIKYAEQTGKPVRYLEAAQ